MTFALKDFGTLKKEFNDKVIVILKREQLDKGLENLPKVEDLPPRRRDEILFLTTVLSQLEAQKELKSHEKSTIFYGAMLLIQKDIKNNLNTEGINIIARQEKLENSLLNSSLNEVMNKSAENAPTNLQLTDFYREINAFMRRIFTESDSRKGLSKSHALQVIPFERLAVLANTAYKLEEAATKASIAEMNKEGKSRPDAMTVTKSAPKALTDALGSWEDLKKSLENLIQDERATKNKATVKALSPQRSVQLQFLQTVTQSLTESRNWGINDAQKVAILTGCMYLVREQIRVEYKMDTLTRDDIPKGLLSSGSVVHDKLTTLLKAKTESVENIEALVAAANEYIRHMAIERVVTKEGVKTNFRAEHIFSTIEGLDLTAFLNLALKMIKTCRLEALQRCVTDVKNELEAAKPKEATPSYFSSAYNWFSKKPSKAEEDDDEELEDSNELEPSTAPKV
ncbi:hypothetical protein [Legionella shakespearei]|uniref:Substrate of the Dot/Icm secretion system n=1 Tax=Legionella shakespearei DSM 23087 TaxID=1122169 RepID=A0A0W0YHL9_9GAMM|nr:hypothetical protein [Legionella shakespearei]KTD56412.1 substrate of the Dot/Icm secretion system [Legionella shakespearei DSM 23087]